MPAIKDLTIRNVNDLYVELKTKLDAGRPIKLNLKQVKQADTAGLQLLLALQLECQRRNKTIELIKPSAELEEIAALLGLHQVLGFGDGISAE